MPGPSDQRESSPDLTGTGEDYPSWVIPEAVRPPRRHRVTSPRAGAGGHREEPGRDGAGPPPPPSARARATRARRTRRRAVLAGGLAAAAALAAGLILLVLPGGSGRSSAGAGGLVTSYLPGEFRTVPDTCDAVSPATLHQYLPGKLTQTSLPSLTGNPGNQCDWTLDHRPTYRLLQVTAQAYAPSGLAGGNGSATSAAQDGYGQALQGMLHPPRSTRQPRARVTTIGGLGTAAFSAFSVITVGGDTTDRVTVVARFRNVLITVQFSGLDHADQGGYGPVSPSLLATGAIAATGDVLQKI